MSAPAASVLAVRIVHPAAAEPITTPSAVPAPLSAATPKREPEPSTPFSQPRTQADAGAAVAATADHKDQRTEPRATARMPSRPDPVAPASTSLAAAPEYALGINLDPGPRPLDEIDPDYPDPVRLRSGTVVLRLLISDTGHVDEVGVVRADPPGVFEQAAIDAFSKVRFAPGMAGGRPVKSQIRIEVEFMPINRGARTSGRSY